MINVPRSASHRAIALGLAIAVMAALPAPASAQNRSSHGSVEQRLQRVERLLESRALVDLLQRVDALQQQIQRLQGADEVQDHKIDLLDRQQQQLSSELTQRLQSIDDSAAKASESAKDTVKPEVSDAPATGQATTAAAATPTSETSVADPEQQRTAYKQAFQLLRDGDYPSAIIALQAVISHYPDGIYAANAQYWIGEAHYVERQFELAEQAFHKLIDNYPDSAKGADAMLKLGLIHAERQQFDAARAAFEAVIARYPGSTAATLAKKRLE